MHVIGAKAVCFKEALQPEFVTYQKQVLANAQTLAKCLQDNGLRLVSGGTDNHLILVDLRGTQHTGKSLTEMLDKIHITVNANTIPFDPAPPKIASGIRVGTPASTTRGMKEEEMKIIGGIIADVIKNGESVLDQNMKKVLELTDRFPLYPNDVIE